MVGIVGTAVILHRVHYFRMAQKKKVRKESEDITEETDKPSDYEVCGFCGFDHSYDYENAVKWHRQNDPNGVFYK
jgi:hypothetical protein